MAVLTAAEYKAIRVTLYRTGQGKEQLKALPNLPNKAMLLAIFQAIEDNSQASRVEMKAAMDAAAGFTLVSALAIRLYRAYTALRGV